MRNLFIQLVIDGLIVFGVIRISGRGVALISGNVAFGSRDAARESSVSSEAFNFALRAAYDALVVDYRLVAFRIGFFVGSLSKKRSKE